MNLNNWIQVKLILKIMKYLKIVIMRGLPGSGKSTLSKKIVEQNPTKWVRICRDDLRNMCHPYWIPKREKLISIFEKELIRNTLIQGYNVVLDATNFKSDWVINIVDEIEEIYEDTKITIEYKSLDTPLWKCIWRDFKRRLFGNRSVGYKVIISFYNKYKSIIP